MKKLLLPLCLLVNLNFSAQALPPGLVSYWAADGNALDFTGANPGSLSGDSTYGPGRFGQAFEFSGGGGAFFAPLTGEPLGNSDRTLEAWVNLDSYHGGGDFYAGYGLGWQSNATYSMGDQWGTGFFSQWGQAIFAGSVTTGVWHHVASVSLAGLTTLYLDGSAVGSGALPLATPDGTGLRLGMGFPGESYALDGRVDDVALWNRALSAAEIQGHFLHGMGIQVPEPALKALADLF